MASERAARVQLQETVQSWEDHYREEQDAGDESLEHPRRLPHFDEEEAEAVEGHVQVARSRPMRTSYLLRVASFRDLDICPGETLTSPGGRR